MAGCRKARKAIIMLMVKIGVSPVEWLICDLDSLYLAETEVAKCQSGLHSLGATWSSEEVILLEANRVGI